ncbi:MAG: hypothetical protein P1V81_09010, partial [Planctomycetota bacterium]|nr:hypothetical protein [Planctomycetota bacterium]
MQLTGAETHAEVGGLTVHANTNPVLVLTEGATAQVERTLWRAQDTTPLVSTTQGTSLRLGSVDQIGSAELALAGAGTIELGTPIKTLELASLARSLDPIVVSDSDGLKAALTNSLAPDVVVHMQPGAYLLAGVELFGDAVLVGLGEGVQLQVRSDTSDHILRVPEGVDLVIENVELGVRTWRPAEAGSAVAKAGGAYLLDFSHEVYELLQVEGEVLLEGVSQLRQAGGDKAARELIAKVGKRGRLVSFGLSGGRGLVVEGHAQLAGGGVDILQVSGKGSVELTGRGHLERIEVTGSATRVLLDDLRPERLDFAAFRAGANDPRSKLRQLHDGVDPEAFRDQLIAEARTRWLTDIPAGTEERGAALVAYVVAHDRALAYTQPNLDERADAAVAVVAPYLRGDVPLIQVVIESTSYSNVPYALNQAFYRDMDPDDYRSFISANRARHALGDDATAEAVETYATWEEAVLAGEVTRDTSNIWQGMGRSLAEWRANELRVAREAAAREREVTAALASGDRARIKKALKAVGLDRWLKYVRYDDEASLYELEEALAAARGSEHQYALMRRRDELQAAQAPPASSYGSSYG